jgi:hypothetical protein
MLGDTASSLAGLRQGQPIEKVKASSLSQLVPRTYSTAKARIVIIKCKEKEDQLGKRHYVFGICEDSTFRIPFICYKPYPYFIRDAVLAFRDCYVHEFNEKSLLLVVNEHATIDYLPNEDPAKYVWHPVIGDIKRAMGSCRVTLQGTLSQISSSSGQVERCETCGRVAFEGKCPNGHESELFSAVRIAGRLSDTTGSINVVFPQHLACKLVGRTVGEILRLTGDTYSGPSEFTPESFALEIPDQIEIGEAYAEDPDQFRSARSPVVVDLNDSRIIYPNNLKPQEILGAEARKLDLSKPEDRRDLIRLAGKLLEARIRASTQLPKMNGLLLTEKPIPLYRTENASLYAGFKLRLRLLKSDQLSVEALPTVDLFESLLDYVNWRRQRGASPRATKNTILNYRRNVIFAPNGELASIIDIRFKRAAEFTVPAYELTLPDFWKKIHDIEVGPDETPLIVLKSYRFDLELTFPPSCVFYDKHSLALNYSTQRLIERTRVRTRQKARDVLGRAISDFSIGDYKLQKAQPTCSRTDTKELLLADIREKLLGKTVKATGSIIQANNQLYFIPRRVDGVF